MAHVPPTSSSAAATPPAGATQRRRAAVTALVTCKNEEFHIGDCLESVAWADEILMADSGSMDRTMEIGRAHAARIIEREYVYPADFKNWAIPQATHEWVFVIDADERCPPELRDEILRELEHPRHDGYWIRRRSFFMGREMRHGGWDTDRVLRLFRRDSGRYELRRVHEEVVLAHGEPGRLRTRFVHYPYRSLTQYFEKMNRYSTWSAMDLHAAGKRASLVNLLLRPKVRFLKMYVVRLGFLDGKAGLVLALLSAFGVLAKYAKLWRLAEAPNRADDAGGEP